MSLDFSGLSLLLDKRLDTKLPFKKQAKHFKTVICIKSSKGDFS